MVFSICLSLRECKAKIAFLCKLCHGYVFPNSDVSVFISLGIKPSLVRASKILPVIWSVPPYGWFKINTDGLSKGNPGQSACGGIIRICHGVFHGCFAMPLGSRTTFFFELMAIILAIEIASKKGWNNVWIESDSLSAINCFQSNDFLPYWELYSRWMDCKFRLHNMQVKFSHTFCEGNRVADCLANLGLQSSEFIFWDHPPVEIQLVCRFMGFPLLPFFLMYSFEG
ncbi:hypothetical protein Q3G72_006022 [Acer saccharum]|nr:hypothetical protein Q3G72_006022 [Acer saccharum]